MLQPNFSPPIPNTNLRSRSIDYARRSIPTWIRAASSISTSPEQDLPRRHSTEHICPACREAVSEIHIPRIRASRAATELVEQARRAVLDHFNAPVGEYRVIFTANASAACRIIGEAYPFTQDTRFASTADNHNSVTGVREFARAKDSATASVLITTPDLRTTDEAVRTALSDHVRPAFLDSRPEPNSRRGLFAYPAQSNFTGVQHPLDWVEMAHDYGYDVLLDAAAYPPANELDLDAVQPDFIPVSWYKLFGYPTGVGCLIAREEALARMRRPWFAGGTVTAASVLGDWHVPTDDESAYEDGTLNFLSIPDVTFGIGWLNGLGIDLVGRRVRCLTGWLLDRLRS
ncbi:aminotransferase class V-fold PLP-dependent enzyme [Nocardia beijingensis]|uniref:aminotransferase class V-fold PLP-dependent enzyme n=1 Tax=Nocardia beijingensis TaxID=95162 RepID=UPI00226BBEE0|nr:aminotransferase class V-fold PLP-dependent enzyme [Nocardia beijingensis]